MTGFLNFLFSHSSLLHFVRYIEASKARLYNSRGHSDSSVAQAVLLYISVEVCLNSGMVLGMISALEWALPQRKEALMVSHWPQTSLPRHANSIKKFENFQALTRAIRNARAEYSVEPGKRISASIVASEEVIQYISEEKEVLALLSRLDAQNAYLPLADMIDISAEVERLSRRLSKMQTEYDRLKARLSSPNFVEKAPEDVVHGVQEKAAEAEEKIILTKNRLALLKSSVLVTE
ncbi:valine--trna ligase [Quercus suber]|uniref:valine--tRNA ligase n=1 Tax=Quercus suber TaxID=58331 RepID=A0AAW0MCJ6_QUESU